MSQETSSGGETVQVQWLSKLPRSWQQVRGLRDGLGLAGRPSGQHDEIPSDCILIIEVPGATSAATLMKLAMLQLRYATYAGLAGVDAEDHQAKAAGLPPHDSLASQLQVVEYIDRVALAPAMWHFKTSLVWLPSPLRYL